MKRLGGVSGDVYALYDGAICVKAVGPSGTFVRLTPGDADRFARLIIALIREDEPDFSTEDADLMATTFVPEEVSANVADGHVLLKVVQGSGDPSDWGVGEAAGLAGILLRLAEVARK